MPPKQSLQHVVLRGENVPHIMKNRKSKSFPKIGERGRRKTQFHVIDELPRAAERET